MPTELLPTRSRNRLSREPLTGGVWLALALHVLAAGGVLGWTLVHYTRHPSFGSVNPVAGSIQASMVSALPLPPRTPVVDRSVLASEKPNIAPPPPPPPQPAPPTPKPKSEAKPEPPPRRDEIPLNKPAAPKPVKPVPDRPAKPLAAIKPSPETRPAPPRAQPAPPTPKATTGDPGTQIPQSTTELKNGTATITVEERSFGERFAYYIRLISQKVNAARAAEEPDPPEARGKRTVIRFTIDRDGTPIEAEVETRSGSLALDRSALRAIQRIDTFGPLPSGDRLTVDFGFTDH